MTFMDVIVSTTGTPQGRGGSAWTTAANHWAEAVGQVGRDALKAKCPLGKGPHKGRLRDSIRLQRSSGAAVVRAEFVAYAPYAGYVVDGTKAHEIVPRSAKVLHFQAADGTEVFTRRVNHPGTRPNPFPRRALEPLLPEMRASFTEIMAKALGGI